MKYIAAICIGASSLYVSANAAEDIAAGSIVRKVSVGRGVLTAADRIVLGKLGRGAALIEGQHLVELKTILTSCLSKEWATDSIKLSDGEFNLISITASIKVECVNGIHYENLISFPLSKAIIKDAAKYKELIDWIELLPDAIWKK